MYDIKVTAAHSDTLPPIQISEIVKEGDNNF